MSDKRPLRPALKLSEIVKRYKLYATPAAQATDLIGLGFLLSHRSARPFNALDGVSLEVRHGERVGVIGRNGAGKSTLLRLVTEKTEPTAGSLEVNGRVQALMEIGVGFHDDFSGYENIRAALQYGEFGRTDIEDAIAEIVDFCELGEFIHEPLRKYSTGMKMRVFFAVATAIRPDILVIDEVLGAGDQYFAARSAQRLRDLATGGCTLLLVSHSMQQVIDFCDRAIWIEAGKIVLEGPTLAVVKAYEEFVQRLTDVRRTDGDTIGPVTQQTEITRRIVQAVVSGQETPASVPGGISRWPSSGRVVVRDCFALTDQGERHAVDARSPFDIVIEVERKDPAVASFRASVVIFSKDGNWITRIVSPRLDFTAGAKLAKCVFRAETCLLVDGAYVMSASLHEANEPWDLVAAERYDLVSRSYKLDVVGAGASGGLARLPIVWKVEQPSRAACCVA